MLAQNVAVSGANAGNGSYATLQSAFAAINVAGNNGSGPISVLISNSTTETGTAVLDNFTWASVTVTATAPVTVQGSIVGAIVKLNGADNVTIDGRIAGTGRNITIQNNSNTTATAAVWLASVVAGNGATNNTIRNCNIACGAPQNTGTLTTIGVLIGGTTISVTATTGLDNDNNSIIDNYITKCRYGISTRGQSATNLGQNNTITDNLVGPVSFGADEIGKAGILAVFENNCTISRNEVRFVGGDFANTTGGTDRVGIGLGSESWSQSATTTTTNTNFIVNRNLIHDIIEERTFSACGIILATTNGGTATNDLICSNMIYNVKSNGTAGDQVAGIGITGGHTINVVHNSIYLYGDVDPNPSATSTSIYGAGIRISQTTSTSFANLNIKNNAIHIDLSSSSTAAARYYAISCPNNTMSFGTGGLNNNDYYVNPLNPQCVLGGYGNTSATAHTSQFTSLGTWQAVFTPNQDANSISANPNFISVTNLHSDLGSTVLNNNGTPIATCAIDFDNDARSITTPDIGADEYTPLVCMGAAGGTISPSTVNRCVGQTYTMTAVGVDVGAGISYQWEISATGGGVGFSNVSGGVGANTASYTTSALTAGVYYYRLRVECSNGPVTGYSNELMLTVNSNPVVSVDVPSASYCNPNGAAITINASGATTYSWLPIAGLDVATGATVMATPASTTTYTVTGTDGNGCTATATSIITVQTGVTISSVTATPPTVCSGNNSQLQVVATSPGANTAAGTIYAAGTASFEIIPGPISVTAPTSGTADDGFEPVNTTGSFEFNYNGVNYNNFVISTNGYVVMGTSFPAGTGIATTLTTTILNGFNAVIGYGRDGNINVTNGGSINHGLDASGTKYVFEYFNFATASGGAESATQTANFQIVLWGNASSTPGKIELIYGTSVGTPATTACLGLRDASGSTAFKNALTGSSTVASTTATFPVDQTMYSFTRQTFSYLWSPSTFIAGQETLSNPVATAVTSTTPYTVTATSGNGCFTTGNVTVTVEPLACAAAVAGPINCENTNFIVTANHTGGGAPFNYSWDDGNGGVYPNAASITANLPVGVYTFTCTVSDACGSNCISSVSVTVNPNPVTTVTPTTGIICNPGGSPITLTAAGALTYAWSPASGLSATTGDNVIANPSGSRTYTVTGTDGNGCTSFTTAAITVGAAITATATATPAIVCNGDNSQLDVVITPAPGAGSIKITEVTSFRTGTGATIPYPAYVVGQDLVEISNISSSAVDISGWAVQDYANNSATVSHAGFTFPGGTILPPATVAVVHLGTGTDDLANFYFNTGGTNDSWLSTSIYGIVLKNGTTVIDAVGRGNPYVWNAGTGVTAADWSGNIATTSAAGIVRTAAFDNNLGSDWVLSTITQATIGTFNSGYIPPVSIASYAWSPSAFIAGQEGLQNPLATAVVSATGYSVVVTTADGCTATGNTSVAVNEAPAANAGPGDHLCSITAAYTLSGATASNYSSVSWTTSGDGSFNNASALNPTYTPGPNDLSNGTVTLTLTAFNPPCPSASSNVTITYYNAVEYFTDGDGDTYGGASAGLFCSDPGAGFVQAGGDCNDGNAAVNPAASESCNGIDDDCNGLVDDNVPALPNVGPISGAVTACLPGVAGSTSYSIASVLGATTYVWSVPSGFTITSGQGTTSIMVSWTATAIQSGISGALCVYAADACVSTAPSCAAVDYQVAAPVTPPSISGPGKVCPGDVVVYSIAAVNRATSYAWTVPSTMTITAGQGSNTITALVNSGYVGGTVTVVASNVCGTSPTRSKSLTQNLPATPTAIQGQKEGLCNTVGNAFSIPAVANATSYNWGITGGIIASGQGTTGISVDVALLTGSGSITVQAVNGCGTSLTRSLVIKGSPARPDPISGSVSVCDNTTEPYSVATVAGADAYTWVVSSGSVSSGQGTKNITVDWAAPAAGQTMSVTTSNACGSSLSRSLTGITVNNCPRFGMNADQVNLNAFPNPASDRATIQFTSVDDSDYRLRISDITGRTLFLENGTAAAGLNTKVLSLDGFASGVYNLTIEMDNAQQQIKLIVE